MSAPWLDASSPGAWWLTGDVRDVLPNLPAQSVDLVFTSPPFLALRSYLPPGHEDKHREIGSEATPADFLDTLLDVVEACDRVLAPHGSLVFEIGDTYAGSGGAGGDYNEGGLRDGQPKFKARWDRADRSDYGTGAAARPARVGRDRNRKNPMPEGAHSAGGAGWPLDKSLCGIPSLFAFSLAYGRNLLRPERETDRWRVRNLIVWHRPNPPVGALGDKCRPSCSFLTVATKSRTRWFDMDAVREPRSANTHNRLAKGAAARENDNKSGADGRGGGWSTLRIADQDESAGAPLQDWLEFPDELDDEGWTISTEPYRGSHYACVDADTEALTPKGWRRHTDLSDGDLIAAYDHRLDWITWKPAKFVRYEVTDETLVAIEKEQTSQRLTTDHRMLVRSVKRPEPFVKLAGEVASGCDLMLSAPWGEDGEEGPGVDRAALLGWAITEGSYSHNQVILYQSETASPDKVASIRALLDRLGATYRETRRDRPYKDRRSVEVSFRISGAESEWVRSHPHKAIPAEVLGWSRAERQALLDALVDGDGCRRADGRFSFIQQDQACADMFQALAISLGYRAVVKSRGYSFVVYVSINRWVTLRGADGWKAPVPRESYTGVVWCPQVSTTFWLARRSGKPFITGNTFPRELAKRVILLQCPERVCRACGEPSRRIVERESAGVGFRKSRENLHDQPPSTGFYESHRDTLGWTDCGHDAWRPGVVLDPFAGSGTTLAVAVGNGRSGVGIDLDGRNFELARGRCGMFLAEVTP